MPIGTVEYYILYMLAVIAILAFAVGVYRRVKSYIAGLDNEFECTGDLSTRIADAARIALSNKEQFDRNLYAGLIRSCRTVLYRQPGA